MNIIVSEGYRDSLSMSTNKTARICMEYITCRFTYKVKVVGMLTKIPGLFMTGYINPLIAQAQLISEVQYKSMIDDFLKVEQKARKPYADILKRYNFTNGVPKTKLFVKLNQTISQERRDFISNGIR